VDQRNLCFGRKWTKRDIYHLNQGLKFGFKSIKQTRKAAARLGIRILGEEKQ
jgi:hypothetical protein